MSAELVSWLAVLTAFSLYGLLSGVELGVALMRVEPRLAPVKLSKKVFTPRWEITNVLLLVGCLGMFAVSPEASEVIIREAWPVLFAGLSALVLRAALLAYLFVHKTAPGRHLLNYLFVFVSLVVPLSLGAAGIYMVTGSSFWESVIGLTLFGSLLVGLLSLGFGFVYYVGRNHAPQGVVLLCRMLGMALAGILAVVLLSVLNGGGSHLFNLSYSYLAVIAAGIVLAQSVFMASGKEWRMWWCLAGLAILAPFLLGLANYPYLIFPEILL